MKKLTDLSFLDLSSVGTGFYGFVFLSDLSYDPLKKLTDLSNVGFVHCLICVLWIWDLRIWDLSDTYFMDLWQRPLGAVHKSFLCLIRRLMHFI